MTTTQQRPDDGTAETRVAEPGEQQSDVELVEAAIEALTGVLPVPVSLSAAVVAAVVVVLVVRPPRTSTAG